MPRGKPPGTSVDTSLVGAAGGGKGGGKQKGGGGKAKDYLIGAGLVGSTGGLIAVSVLGTITTITGGVLAKETVDNILQFLSDPFTLVVIGGVILVVFTGGGGSSAK